MQLRLLDPGRPDFQRERARQWLDDELRGEAVLVWTDDNIMRDTAPYKGVWRGFYPDGFMGGIMGMLEHDTGSTTHIGPLGIVAVEKYDPLLEVEKRLANFLGAL